MRLFLTSLAVLITLIMPAEVRSAENSERSAVSSYFLENGLQLVVIPDRRAPVVTHMIWYKAGSVEDPPGKSGIAHFLEHLMFKGTVKHEEGAFSNSVAEIGGEENAFTTADYTGYYQKIAPSALGKMMAFEADRMRNLVLSDAVVLPELEVILEERSQRVSSNPNAILSETAQAALFVHHPYGTPVIGWEHEIRSLTREDAISFYDKWYRPSNAVVIVAGDVEPDEVLELARATYGLIKAESEPLSRRTVIEPEPTVARSVSYSDPRVTTPSWRRSYLVPSYQKASPGEAEALDLLGGVLGGASTSRFHRKLVLESQISSSAGAYYQGAARDMTYFVVYGSPRGENDLGAVEQAIDAQIKTLLEEGVTEEELVRARQNILKSIIYAQDSQVTLARIYGSVLAMGGTISDVRDWTEKLNAVTVEDVDRVARKYLVMPRSVTSYLRPKG